MVVVAVLVENGQACRTGEKSTMDYRNEVIAGLARGKSFAEIGGLWGLVNEKISVAHEAGASHFCAVDIWKSDSEWWAKFRERCAELRITVREIIGSIDNLEIVSQVGRYDIVHCAGVLYHCPNPMLTIANLAAITKETLILTSAVMPEVISNERGTLMLSEDKAICIPCISEYHRRIADLYITQKYGGGAWGINSPVDAWYFADGSPNYGPWWWLWTPAYVRRLLMAAGLSIVDERNQFDGTGHLFVCQRAENKIENFGAF
jgi:hypothetical protein